MNNLKQIPLPIWVSLALYKLWNIYRLIVNKKGIESEIRKQIAIFHPNGGGGGNSQLINDIKKCYVKHLAKPQEFFLLGFENQSDNERSEWITDFIKDTYLKKYAKLERAKELQDKFCFYEKMKSYFKRDACMVSGEKDKDAYFLFSNKHRRFIAKPNTGSFGANTSIFDLHEENQETVFSELLASKSSWILEELINQVPEMGLFNPSSVNSVRIPTFHTKRGYIVFGTFMRMGRKGSVVDNAGAGGIFVRIDEETGKITSDGYTEHGAIYDHHPDSHVKFKGFQIPLWDELKTLAIQCHKELPEHKYIGWDFALTDNGWVLLEGNWGQFLCQQVSGQKPLKNQFVSLIKG